MKMVWWPQFLILVLTAIFTNAAVNHNTGTMVLSERLMTAKGHRLALPLTLNYDSGLKKSQRASWVGLGFDLDVPYIERTVRGGPDENSLELTDYLRDLKELLTVTGNDGPYKSLPKNPEGYKDLIQKVGVADGESLRFVVKNYQPLIEKVDEAWVLNNLIPIEEGISDLCVSESFYDLVECQLLDRVSHPRCRYPVGDYSNQQYQDAYQLHNFPAGGGQLFFTSTGGSKAPQSLNAAVNPYRPWKIEFTGDWTITDENGIRYQFDKKVRVRNGKNLQWNRTYYMDIGTSSPVERKYDLVDRSNDGQEYTWRWYLKKMTAYDGEEIEIEYEQAPGEQEQVETPIFTDIQKNVLTVDKPLFHIDIDLHVGYETFAGVPWYLVFLYKESNSTEVDSMVFFLERKDSYRTLHTTFHTPRELSYTPNGVVFAGVKIVVPWTQDESYDPEDNERYFSYFLNSGGPEELAKGVIEWNTPRAYWFRIPNGSEYRIHSEGDESFADIFATIRHELQSWTPNKVVDEKGRIQDLSTSVGLHGKLEYSTAHALGKIAYKAEDMSKTIINRCYPKRIKTALQEVVFGTVDDPNAEPGKTGRPRLSWVEKKRGGARIQRVEFGQQIQVNGGHLQLDDVYISKASGGKERLYHFSYQNRTEPRFVEDLFGTRLNGYVTTVTDYSGKRSDYHYEQGWCDRLSNNSELTVSERVRCGLRVFKVVESSEQTVSPAVTRRIEYAEGEIPVTDGLLIERDGYDKELWPGLKKTLGLCQYDAWTERIPLQLNYDINYGRVTVSRFNVGETEFEYYNSGDDYWHSSRLYSLADDDSDRYHLNSLLRHRPKSVTQRNSAGGIVKKTDYRFSVWPRSEFIYRKPDTRQREMAVVANNLNPDDGSDRTFCLTYPSESYSSAGFQGTAAATLVKSVAVGQKSITSVRDGVSYKTEYQINEYGQAVWEKKYKGADETSEAVVLYHTYGYETENNGFVAANLYSPIIKTVVATKSAGTYEQGATETIRRATVEPWAVHWPGVTSYKPFENFPFYATGQYLWRMPEDGTGNPTEKYTEPADLWNLPSDTWFCPERITRRSLKRSGQLLEMEINNGAVHSSLIYRHDFSSPIGEATNSRYLECGVFTCDYEETGASHFDSYNAWERGGSELSGISHFGKNTVRIGNGDIGPTRNSRLYPSTDYILSAWVKVNAGSIVLSGKYRYFSKEIETEPQEQLPIRFTVDGVSAGARDFSVDPKTIGSSAAWQYIEIRIPAKTDISSTDWSNSNWYCRVSVGSGGGEIDALVEDIRFYPADALMTTTYYDERGRALCSINENNNPSRYTMYDDFDRVTGTYKVNPVKDASSQDFLKQITATETYRMGDLAQGEKLRIVSPNGGERFSAGSTVPIRWLAASDIHKVRLQYTPDNGLTLHTIGTADISRDDENWGAYLWTVPDFVSNQVRIHVRQASNPALERISDHAFSVGAWVYENDFDESELPDFEPSDDANTVTRVEKYLGLESGYEYWNKLERGTAAGTVPYLPLPASKVSGKKIYIKGRLRTPYGSTAYLISTVKHTEGLEIVEGIAEVEGIGVWEPFTFEADYREYSLESVEFGVGSLDAEVEIDNIKVYAEE